jgi:hypothetical protein
MNFYFVEFQTAFGKAFWFITIMMMLSLGIYFCAQVYQNWIEKPVLTTITSAGLPVEKVMNSFFLNYYFKKFI